MIRTTLIRLVLGLGAFSLGAALPTGCKSKKKKKGPDKEIQNLKKSGDEFSEATRSLLTKRSSLAAERAKLTQRRQALAEKKKALAKGDIEGLAKLQKEEDELNKLEQSIKQRQNKINDRLLSQLRRGEEFIKRASAALTARTASSGGDPTAGVRSRERVMASREKDLARREARIAERERDMAKREKQLIEDRAKKCAAAGSIITTVTVPSVSGDTGATKGSARAAIAKVRSVMGSKGIRFGDLPGSLTKLYSDARSYYNKKDYARAKAYANTLYGALRGIRIDRGFVGAKMGRLARIMRKKKMSSKIRKLFAQVTTAFNNASFRTANSKINRIYSLIK